MLGSEPAVYLLGKDSSTRAPPHSSSIAFSEAERKLGKGSALEGIFITSVCLLLAGLGVQMAWELTAGPDLEISLISYSLSSCLPAFCGVHPPVCGGLHAEAFKDQRGRAKISL